MKQVNLVSNVCAVRLVSLKSSFASIYMYPVTTSVDNRSVTYIWCEYSIILYRTFSPNIKRGTNFWCFLVAFNKLFNSNCLRFMFYYYMQSHNSLQMYISSHRIATTLATTPMPTRNNNPSKIYQLMSTAHLCITFCFLHASSICNIKYTTTVNKLNQVFVLAITHYCSNKYHLKYNL